MLVLSRQRDETIMIGDDIEITVVDIRGDKVRLGINAPARVAVHRKEVYEAIRKENEQAARSAGDAIPDIAKVAVGPGGKLAASGGGAVRPAAPAATIGPPRLGVVRPPGPALPGVGAGAIPPVIPVAVQPQRKQA